jgi:SAM-dependent methyltransferase
MDNKRIKYIEMFDNNKMALALTYIKQKQQSKNYILDIGCGYGKYAKFYSGDAQYIGLNIDKKEVIIAQQLNSIYGYNFILADANTISCFKENSFDLVILIYVMEHIKDPDNLIKAISNILKKDGILFIWTSNIYSFNGFFISILPNNIKQYIKRKLTHVHEEYPTFYRANSISKLKLFANKNGLILEKYETLSELGYFYKYPGFYYINNFFVRVFNNKYLQRFRSAVLISFKKE